MRISFKMDNLEAGLSGRNLKSVPVLGSFFRGSSFRWSGDLTVHFGATLECAIELGALAQMTQFDLILTHKQGCNGRWRGSPPTSRNRGNFSLLWAFIYVIYATIYHVSRQKKITTTPLLARNRFSV